MMPSISISRRGILLVVFPLACQLIFVGFLITLLISMQSEIDREQQSKFLIEKGEWLFRSSMENLMQLPLDPGRSTDDPNEFKRTLETMNANFAEVTKLAAQVPEQTRQVSELNRLAASMDNVLNWIRTERTRVPQSPDFSRMMEIKSRGLMSQFFEVTSSLVEVEDARRTACLERVAVLKDRLNTSLYVAIPASFLLSLLLGYFYAFGIRRPLEQITQNSRLLSQQRDLLPELKGTDELAELDGLFHVVALSVKEAQGKEFALVDNAADLICSLNQDGVFTRANPYARQMLQYDAQELVGMALFELVFQDDILHAEQQTAEVRGAAEMRSFDLRMKRKDGSVIDTRWTAFWSEREEALFCVVHDATEQKNIERLKEDFVDMISHDLRSPLMSMGGTMELIAAGATGELLAPVEKEVKTAQRNIDRLTNFVNDLLDFQKLKAGKMQIDVAPCDFESVLAESIDLIRAQADAKGIVLDIAAGSWKVDCDRAKVVQIVVNIVSNAIKFSPQQGRIALRVLDADDGLTFEVCDSGPGVPQEFRELIFQAFEQVPNSPQRREGTGLGLAICKLIVEAHGGSIGVRSSEVENADGSRGSVFWFSLPRLPGLPIT